MATVPVTSLKSAQTLPFLMPEKLRREGAGKGLPSRGHGRPILWVVLRLLLKMGIGEPLLSLLPCSIEKPAQLPRRGL